MFKLINLNVLFLLLFSNCALAQTGFDISPSNEPSSSPTTSMSPSEFKSAVSNRSQQTTNNLNQQAKQLFPKQPSTSKAPGALPGTPAQPAAPSSVDNSFSINNSNTPPAQPGVAPSTPSQSDGYTGFGPGKKNDSKPSTPASGSSGGWNINY